MGKFSGLKSVEDHRDKALVHALAAARDRIYGCLNDADLETESPIEAIFKVWWEALAIEHYFRIRELDLNAQFQAEPRKGVLYRVDFAVIPNDVEMWLEGDVLGVRYQHVGLELDGHDFHEKTKEQVTHRNQRDRDLQADGWKMLHFSGSEIYRNPLAVVQEAAKAGTDALNAFQREMRAKKRARGDYGK